MPTQENPIATDVVSTGSGANPPLVEVTSQLLPDAAATNSVSATSSLKKPQVVFVEQRRKTHVIEIHVEPKAAVETQVVTDPVEVVTENVSAPPAVPPYGTPSLENEGRFVVDPFVYEIDGPIPVMPTLPIIEPETSTDQVVAREQSGDHFAWRLLPSYPAEGNVPQVPADETAEHVQPPMSPSQAIAGESWAETEVVAENECGENRENEDCFYAQAGDVISIDGNKGFDHIDLRSYSIEDATFQPGAILLHADLKTAELGEGEQHPAPITIQHRGIEFAIFKGEIQVEL